MIAALKEIGGEPRYTEYPDAGHDSWTQTYADEAVFRWLFSQQRATGSGAGK
jgi:predicted peptidase